MVFGMVIGAWLLAPAVPEPEPPRDETSPPAEDELAAPEDGALAVEPVEPVAAEPSTSTATTYDPMAGLPSAAVDDETPSIADAPPPVDRFRRRGFIITLGAGITHCAQDLCTPIPMGGLGRLELGYRLTRVAFVATVTGGGGRTDDPDAQETSIRMLDAAAGVLLLPVRQGPVDPFVGASLGYSSTSRVFGDSSSIDRQFTKRGALRLSGGLLWYVAPRLALGPRVDVQLPFAGEWCTRNANDRGEDFCESIRKDIIDMDQGKQAQRSVRRAFPRPWAVTLDLRIAL